MVVWGSVEVVLEYHGGFEREPRERVFVVMVVRSREMRAPIR